jgi:hypothetical protein
MKIMIENTSEIVQVFATKDMSGPIPARVWEGKTESGIAVTCLITRIAVKNTDDCAQFEQELQETKPPSVDSVNAWPLRMIL